MVIVIDEIIPKGDNVEKNKLKENVKQLTKGIQELAEESQDELFDILYILQELESLHSHIRKQMFEPSLPDTRHRLYLLMKHLEEVGGWPYIERMRLRNLCANLQIENPNSQSTVKSEETDNNVDNE